MKRKIGILGAGTWGLALARMLCRNGHEVTVWSKFPAEIEKLKATHTHPNLPGMVIPDEITLTTDPAATCAGQDVLLFAVPSVFVRQTAETVKPYVPEYQLIVDVAKGIEPDTLMTMTQIIGDVLSDKNPRLVALSGPTHAEEVALDMPTSIVAASKDTEAAELAQDVFMNTCMRTYTNRDVLGVELCGALKNIVALASGISAGLGYGDNSRAALITRGMVEITRLGMAMGCMEQTFSGLAGVGDLIVTATSVHSRNNRAGMLIGKGMKPEDAIREVGMVVEGVNAIPAAMQLAAKYGVEMPIVSGVDAIIHRGVAADQVALMLMTRDRKPEYRSACKIPMADAVHRVLTVGRFDCLDWQQMNGIRRAQMLGDELIIGLLTDKACEQLGLPGAVQSFEERRERLEMLRSVSMVFSLSSEEELLTQIRERGISTIAVEEKYVRQINWLRESGLEIIALGGTENT